MRLPSVETLEMVWGLEKAFKIRAALEGPGTDLDRLAAANDALGFYGVEHIEAGKNKKSPAIDYCNSGDTYKFTILLVNGSFRVGSWGDLVERGNYS